MLLLQGRSVRRRSTTSRSRPSITSLNDTWTTTLGSSHMTPPWRPALSQVARLPRAHTPVGVVSSEGSAEGGGAAIGHSIT